MNASFSSHILEFNFKAGTSRGVMTERKTWYLQLQEGKQTGIGECAPLAGLSRDNLDEIEGKLQWVCDNIDLGFAKLYDDLADFPAVRMALETAFISLRGSTPHTLFVNPFSKGKAGIPINGLVWMSDAKEMEKQMAKKIKEGYKCVKMKIGAIDIGEEIAIIERIRETYEPWDLEIRLDANGAFDRSNIFDVIDELSDLEIHSIEQPVNDRQLLKELCAESPVPIALDESLIGINGKEEKEALINDILPDYIVIKPTLVGGFRAAEDWIELAEKNGIGWWVTSALESNIGLNAIAQWLGNYPLRIYQGLGTGKLYNNNIESPLNIRKGKLYYRPTDQWGSI